MNGTHTAPTAETQSGQAAAAPPRPQAKPEAADTAAGTQQGSPAAASASPSPVFPGTHQGGASLLWPPSPCSDMEQPFTFTHPFAAAAELCGGSGGAAGGSTQPPTELAGAQQEELEGGGSRQLSGVLRSSGSDPGRLRHSVSWTDFQNQAPLAQVQEYEPSDRLSTRSEDDWGSPRSSGCLCLVQ